MKTNNLLSKVISNTVLALFSMCCIIPFIIVISISLTDETAIARYGYQVFPKLFSTQAYKILFATPEVIMRAYSVTIFVTIVGTILSILACSQFAYVLSRKIFVFKRQLSFYLFFTMLFNGGLVPTYILITKYLGIKDTVWAIILPLMINAWNIFLLKAFFSKVPDTLIDAAKIDGASEYGVFYKIIVPISTSGIATVSIFIVLSYWNDWYLNMLYISNTKLFNLQYMLYQVMSKINFLKIANEFGVDSGVKMPAEGIRMATCILAAGPMIFVFAFFQKYFVKGITVGAIKG